MKTYKKNHSSNRENMKKNQVKAKNCEFVEYWLENRLGSQHGPDQIMPHSIFGLFIHRSHSFMHNCVKISKISVSPQNRKRRILFSIEIEKPGW